MIWLIALAVLGAAAVIPLKLALAYDAGGFRAAVRVGPVTVYRYPPKKKPETKDASPRNRQGPDGGENNPSTQAQSFKAKPSRQQPSREPESFQNPEEESGGSLEKILPFLRLGWDFLQDLRRKLVVDRLEMDLALAGPDPCDLAVNYGRALAVKESLMPLLERVVEIRKQEIAIRCDFTAERTKLTARADVVLTLGRAVVLAAVYGVRALKEYWKKPKGGAQYESETT